MTWTADPVADAERYYNRQSANTRKWENENYKGLCPLCGKPMYTNAWDYAERATEDWDFPEGWVHESCRDFLIEEEAAEQARRRETA